MESSNLHRMNNKTLKQKKAQIEVAKRGAKAHWRVFDAETLMKQWVELTSREIEPLFVGGKGERQKSLGDFTSEVME